MKNKYILWDIGNVVVFVDDSQIPFDYFSDKNDWSDFESGKITESDFFNKYPELKEGFNKIFKDNIEVINIINSLSQNIQYFFSNTNSCHFNYLKLQYSFLNTNNLFLSFENGLRKPYPEIYSFIQSSLNCSSSEIYFIDDRKENLIIPNKMGWNTFLYNKNNKELKDFLSVK